MLRRAASTVSYEFHVTSSLKNGSKPYKTTSPSSDFSVTNSAEEDYQPVSDFYAGKSVFITGGTGFLGKILIERLLFNCEDIDKVYVMVREKRGVKVEDRLKDIINNEVFSKLKAVRPTDINKIVPIVGDISSFKLGIKPEDMNTLIEKVSVVFHSAAEVRFNKPIKHMTKLNVEGTMELLNLSRQIKNIKAFVYISTAFSNADKGSIEEKVYPPPRKLQEVYEFIENGEIDIKNFLNGKPNNYTFSKALTETIVAEHHGNMPTVIIRPSIVCCVKNEPIPGWLDNWYGGTGLVYYASKGLNRVIPGKKDVLMNLIPVDYTTNLTMVAAARCRSSNEVKVYNSCISLEKSLKWNTWVEEFVKEYQKIDPSNSTKMKFFFSSSPWTLSFLTFVLHTGPAHVADLWLRCKGKEPRYTKELYPIRAVKDALLYFTSNSFTWNVSNARDLYNTLSQDDRKRFPFDPNEMNWNEYMKDYCHGVYKYLVATRNKE